MLLALFLLGLSLVFLALTVERQPPRLPPGSGN